MTPGRCNQLLQHLTSALVVQAHSPSAVDTSAVSISQHAVLMYSYFIDRLPSLFLMLPHTCHEEMLHHTVSGTNIPVVRAL